MNVHADVQRDSVVESPENSSSVKESPVVSELADKDSAIAEEIKESPANSGSVEESPANSGSVEESPANSGSVEESPANSGSVEECQVNSQSVDSCSADSDTYEYNANAMGGTSEPGRADPLEDKFKAGRECLSQYEIGNESTSNATQAVSYFIEASSGGHVEATQLLRQCIDKDIGINDENRGTVEWNISTPRLEKQARYAARALFASLNPLQYDVIPRNLFLQQVDNVTMNKNEKKLLEKAGQKLKEENLTEESFVDRMVSRLQGKGGTSLQTLADPESSHITTATQSWLQKPVQIIIKVADSSMELAAKQGLTFLRALVPTQQIHMLFVFVLYSLLSIAAALKFIPIFLFYFFFMAMAVCTLQMFHNQKKLKDIQALATLLQKFNSALDVNTAESTYSWKSLTPYWMFFISLTITLVSFSMADKAWIPCAELAAVSVFMAGSCFIALSNKYDHLMLVSVLCNLVASLPVIIPNILNIPFIGYFLGFFFGSGFSICVHPEFYINIGLPSLVYLIVPVIFFKMATQAPNDPKKLSWEGTYRTLVPHLVCLFWWQLMLVFYSHTTWFGLARGFLGWISFIILLPFIGVGAVIGGIIFVFRYVSVTSVLKIVTTIALVAIPAVWALWSTRGFTIPGLNFQPTKAGKYSRKGQFRIIGLSSGQSKAVLIGIFALTAIPSMYVMTPAERSVGERYITWSQYSRYCSHAQWKETNMAHSMMLCSHFRHMTAAWSGKVKKVTIKSIDNQIERFVTKMPSRVGNWLRCTYGAEYPPCSTLNTTQERDLCEISSQQDQTCHLEDMNYYTFELWVTMKDDDDDEGHDIRITARNEFKNIMTILQPGSKVKFRAALMDDLGNLWPQLKLYHIECKACVRVKPTNQNETASVTSLMKQALPEMGGLSHGGLLLKNAVYDSLNFLTAPLFEFGSRHPNSNQENNQI